MTQVNPSILLYGQAIVLLKQISDNYANGDVKSADDAAQQLRDVLTQFETSAGKPILSYTPFDDGEPALSSKMNKIWSNLENDVNILQNQVDVLRATSVLTHNLISTEVQKSTAENSRVNNKLKTLQLYSDSVDSSIITFGDNFHDDQFIDTALSINWQQPNISNGLMTLGQQGNLKNLSANSTVTILDTSNGFAGNNQEVNDPTKAPIDPNTNQPIVTFIAETNAADNVKFITDGQPDKWFEYEHCLVTPNDKFRAGNLNFTYRIVKSDGIQEIDWANGPPDGELELDLQIDLGSAQIANYISYTPFGLRDNANGPVLVKEVQVSANGTDWTVVSPTNVWIGTDPNLKAARTADNVTIGVATWSFPSASIQFIRISIHQQSPLQTNLGHVYFLDKTTQNRVKGPSPTLPISGYYNPSNFTYGNTIQGREILTGQRWAIGIRDLLVQSIQYFSQSVIVTKPLLVSGLVDRVALDATIFIPSSFPQDQSWINFFISPDDGKTWNQISRIQDDFLGLPEIIAYNDPLPEAFHEPGVAYINVNNPVTSLRLKIELLRPMDQSSSTPFVENYKLKVRTR